MGQYLRICTPKPEIGAQLWLQYHPPQPLHDTNPFLPHLGIWQMALRLGVVRRGRDMESHPSLRSRRSKAVPRVSMRWKTNKSVCRSGSCVDGFGPRFQNTWSIREYIKGNKRNYSRWKWAEHQHALLSASCLWMPWPPPPGSWCHDSPTLVD